MSHRSVKMMTPGFAAFRWESTSLAIYSRKCTGKLVSQLYIQLTSSEVSYLSDSPQGCRFGKESSERCNGPFKRQVHRVVQHTTNHRAAIRVVWDSQSLHSEAEPIQFCASCCSTYFGTFSNLDSAAKSTPYCRSNENSIPGHPSAADFSHSTFHAFNPSKDTS